MSFTFGVTILSIMTLIDVFIGTIYTIKANHRHFKSSIMEAGLTKKSLNVLLVVGIHMAYIFGIFIHEDKNILGSLYALNGGIVSYYLYAELSSALANISLATGWEPPTVLTKFLALHDERYAKLNKGE